MLDRSGVALAFAKVGIGGTTDDEPPFDEAPAYDFIPEGADEARDMDASAPPALS